MNIDRFCTKLVSEFGCMLLSKVGPEPADIDIYVPNISVLSVLALAKKEGFVQFSGGEGQYVFRRFENNGQQYILDLLTTFDVYTDGVVALQLSSVGNARIGASPKLHESFKYLCFQKKDRLDCILDNQKELVEFLCDENNFVWISRHIVVAARGSVELLMKSMRRAVFDRRWFKLFINNLVWNKLRFILSVRGISVAFIGPDGSGKSFIINKLRDIGCTRVVYMGDWFFTLQGFYNVLLKIPSPWNRFIYVFYLFENYVRLTKVLFWRLMGYNVLIDRYPGTNKNVVCSKCLKMLDYLTFRLFPNPDLFVLVYASPEVVYKRKQELSVEKISKIQEELFHRMANTRHFVFDSEKLDASLNRLLVEII